MNEETKNEEMTEEMTEEIFTEAFDELDTKISSILTEPEAKDLYESKVSYLQNYQPHTLEELKAFVEEAEELAEECAEETQKQNIICSGQEALEDYMTKTASLTPEALLEDISHEELGEMLDEASKEFFRLSSQK